MKQIQRYIEAMVATALDSCVDSAKLALGGTGGAAMLGEQVNWHYVIATSVSVFLYGIASYIKAHPLAAEVEKIQAQAETLASAIHSGKLDTASDDLKGDVSKLLVSETQPKPPTLTKTVLLLVIAAACAGCAAIHLGKLGGDW